MSIFTRALVIREAVAAAPLRSSRRSCSSSRILSRLGRRYQVHGVASSSHYYCHQSHIFMQPYPLSSSSLYFVNQFHTSSPFQTDNQTRNKTEDAAGADLTTQITAVPVQIEQIASTATASILAISSSSTSSTISSPPSSSSSGGSSSNDSSAKGKESSQPSTSPSQSLPPIIPAPRPKKRVSKFFLFKFFEFVQGYNTLLEKKFPGAMNVYRVFMVGVKDFAKELAEYVRISGKVLMSSNGIRQLSSVELEIYYRLPTEVTRVAPTLIISALPFMNYIMFPIAYYFPKRLLSSHFWSIQQKSQFAIDAQKSRLYNYRPVFRSLQANVELVRDLALKDKCRAVFDKLGSGSQPSSREIMEIKRLFESDPFSLKAIYGPHVKGLCRMHGIHTIYLNRMRLNDRAEMLHVMDEALLRDGIFNLKTEDLKTACFIRGLNASNTSHEDMMEYLQNWSSISTSISPPSYSLLLHLPILLAYNNPNNWALLV